MGKKIKKKIKVATCSGKFSTMTVTTTKRKKARLVSSLRNIWPKKKV